MKPFLLTLIGLPGSGKSTYAKKIAEETNAVILSSDDLRFQMFGDANDQEHNAEVFAELHRRCKDLLSKHVNIIYDATNINQKKRTAFLKELNGIDCHKKAVVFATPYELCLENNLKRERKVPEEVIKRMRENFHFPLYNEGFDEIEFVWNMGDKKYDFVEMMTKTYTFDQHNSHHTLSLGEHMNNAFNYLFSNQIRDFNIQMAARIHDIGKLDTQVFHDSKGNPTEEAHYYQHQYVGAYNAMFYLKQLNMFLCSDEEILHICTLIQYHMHPYIAWDDSEKARSRDEKLLGTELYNEVLLLHQSDVAAH